MSDLLAFSITKILTLMRPLTMEKEDKTRINNIVYAYHKFSEHLRNSESLSSCFFI